MSADEQRPDLEQVWELARKIVAGHEAAGEEALGDPVGLVLDLGGEAEQARAWLEEPYPVPPGVTMPEARSGSA